MTVTAKRRLRVLGLVFLGIALFFGVGNKADAQPVNPEAAKKEGKVVIYGTVVPKIMGLIQKGFEAKYGIKIEYWRADATKVIDRALTEWRAGRPNFDVVTGVRGGLALLRRENVFAKYIPPASESFPAKYKEKDALVTPWRVTPVGVLYNTELVKAGDAPRSFDDLLQAKWQGKFAMPDPSRHSSTAQLLWNMEKLKGERWLDFVKALAKQKPHLVDSFAPIPTTIIRGEASLGITYVQYVAQQKGPIGYAPLEKYLADPSDLGLSAKAANPNAGKIFLEYMCSAEGQKLVAGAGEFVLAPGIYPAIQEAEKVAANLVFMDNPTVEQLKKLQSDFRQIFFGR
ncbi:MAG: extracellular solute-binding protein [Deltaproteobacteria bacterium]|nr:extracellular solute-binding protein [Deltaproteobacteria bacterium]